MRFYILRFFIVGVVVVVGTGILSIPFYTSLVRANVYNLYASTCLGGWENTDLATGVPEAQKDGGRVFTKENSARLNGDAHAQIYCGGFSGDILENTIPKKILVKFSWTVEYPKTITKRMSEVDQSATSTEDATEEAENGGKGSEDEEISPEESGGTEKVDETEFAEEVSQDVVEGLEANENQEESEQVTTTEEETVTEETSEPDVLDIPQEEPDSVPEPEPSPEPTMTPEITALFFKGFAKLALAQEADDEVLENMSSTSTDVVEEDVTTTESATTTEDMSYGLVEVVYTLDGIEWKSLGFVDKDEFTGKYFEIPIEEASDWEDISKIQIGVQSVPVLNDIAPVMYLDSVWIETEYEYANQNDEIEEPIPTEEYEIIQDILIEELPAEESLQPIIEPVPLPPRLSVRNFTKEIIIDPNAAHYCEAEPFSINVSGRHFFSTKIALQKSLDEDYELEIGSLPEGVDIKFSRNDDYMYEPDPDENIVSLRIHNEEGSRTGNFTVPIIFTQKDKKDSSTICQINIVNVQ